MKKARQIVYKFLWNKEKGMAWLQMSVPKKEERGGVWGLEIRYCLLKFSPSKEQYKFGELMSLLDKMDVPLTC